MANENEAFTEGNVARVDVRGSAAEWLAWRGVILAAAKKHQSGG